MPFVTASRATAGQTRYVPRATRYAITHGQRRVVKAPPAGSLRGLRGMGDAGDVEDILDQITSATQPLVNAEANQIQYGQYAAYAPNPVTGLLPGQTGVAPTMSPMVLILGAVVVGALFLFNKDGGGMPPITESTTTTRRSR
jgi:hypothetical protein